MIIQLLCLIFSRVFDLKAIWACWALYIYMVLLYLFIYLLIYLFIYLLIYWLVCLIIYLYTHQWRLFH